MIESLVASLIAGATGQASRYLVDAFKDYLRRKGQTVSDTVSEEELVSSLSTLEKTEPQSTAIAEANTIFKSAITQLGAFRKERERQARYSYNLAWVVLGVGSALVLIGITWMGIGNAIQPGMVTSGVGAITSLCSGAIFRFSKEANDRLDDIARNLQRIEIVRVSLSAIQGITDDDDRNSALRELVSQLSTSE